MFDEIKTLIPHQPPMLLVDEILSADAADSRVKSVIGAEHLFLRADGTLAPEAFAEIIAQSFAACEAARRQLAGLSLDGGGYLSTVRDFEVFSYARAHDELVTRVELKDDFMGTRLVHGEVRRGAEILASGTVYIFMWEGKTPPGAQ